jgi:hypothetical protein
MLGPARPSADPGMPALALALAASLAAPPCTLPPLRPEGAPFATGEVLSYDLELVLVKAGRLTLQVDRPMAQGELLPLKARVQNTAAFANIRRLTAVAISWIQLPSLRPERYREDAEEDGLRRSTDVRFLPAGETVTLEQRWKDRQGPKAYPRQGEALDALSALYYLRAARLEPGAKLCLDLVGGGRFWRVVAVQAPGRERVDTPAGRFETFRVDVEATRADVPPGGKNRVRAMHLWLTADARRLPVSIVSEIDVGPVAATLTGWRPAPTP